MCPEETDALAPIPTSATYTPPQPPLERATRVARVVSVTSYFLLLALLVVWHAWLAPSRYFPVALVLLSLVGPLLLPLRGLLDGRPYTHAWTSLLVMLYFLHGVAETYANPDERIYASAEVILSTVLFTSTVLYARWRSRELRF